MSSTFCFLYSFLVLAVAINVSSSKAHGRKPRYVLSENRLPLSPDYQSSRYDNVYSDRLDFTNSLKHGVPSGFDQFVADKSHEKYTYGAGGIYIPYSPKSKADYIVEEMVDQDENELSPKIIDSATKGVKVLTGSETTAPIEMEVSKPPTFLSLVRSFLANPLVAIAITVIPLVFIMALIFPSISDIFGSLNMAPDVTTVFASGFARSLDGLDGTLSMDRVLDVINEYGARSLEDPRCFQRFLCQAAKSGIESRSGDSWSIPKVVQKLAKSVDDRLWDAMGLKHLLHSIQSGHCNRLECSGTPAYQRGEMSLLEKMGRIGVKLLKSTEKNQ